MHYALLLSYKQTEKLSNYDNFTHSTHKIQHSIIKTVETRVQNPFVEQYRVLNQQDYFRLKSCHKTLTIILDGRHKKGSTGGQTGTSTGLRMEHTIFFMKTGEEGFNRKTN